MVTQCGNRTLYALFRGSIARLLCDGTNLREGGEVKGKQDNGVCKSVMSHSNAKTSCQQGNEIIFSVTEYGLVRCLLRMSDGALLIRSLRSRALLKQPPVVQLLKSFPTFYKTRRLITVFTRAL
jgi:hypothetical protein